MVRLLKYLRDHKNSFTAKSILLTTLAGNTIKSSDEGTAAVNTVADTFETILSRMNDYLQRHPNMPGDRESGVAVGGLQPALGPAQVRQFQEPGTFVRSDGEASEIRAVG